MRRSDIAELYFYLGGLFPLVTFCFFIWYYRIDEEEAPTSIFPGKILNDIIITREDDWESVEAIFSMCMWITLVMFATGVAMQIFTKYKVNFVYIFEINPSTALTYY